MKRLILFLFLGVSAAADAQTTAIPQSLRGYIETALAQNPDVQAVRAKWKNTDARVTEATSYLYPRLDFTSKYSTFQGGRIINIPNVGQFNTAALGVVPWDNE